MGNENKSSSNYSMIEEENIIESILFMMGDSVSVETLATAIESNVSVAENAAERLYNKYQNEYKDRGMKVIKLGSKYQMVSNNKYFKNLVLVASHPQKPVITESILETLSIIAYKQPISKPEIEYIRGVKSDYACNKLLEYGLIEEKGRLETPGRPIIFGTTEEFMRRFGIESMDQLPIIDAERFAEIESEVEKEALEEYNEHIVLDREKYADGIFNHVDLQKEDVYDKIDSNDIDDKKDSIVKNNENDKYDIDTTKVDANTLVSKNVNGEIKQEIFEEHIDNVIVEKEDDKINENKTIDSDKIDNENLINEKNVLNGNNESGETNKNNENNENSENNEINNEIDFDYIEDKKKTDEGKGEKPR